jgi:Type I phosphodiesterase / nucleotide pyrophosphatase
MTQRLGQRVSERLIERNGQAYITELVVSVRHSEFSAVDFQYTLNLVELSRRRFAALSTAWLAGSFSATRLAAIPPRPKLFILLVAEQFRSDYLARFSSLFGPGGFRRLMEEGAYFPDCRMRASTFSATGIATIATGAYPDAHGIVAESWYDPATRKMAAAQASLNLSSTVADQIASADPRNRVFAVGADPVRAALLVQSAPFAALRHRILAVDAPVEPAPEEPAWVQAFRQSHSPDRFKNTKWQALQADPAAPPLRTLVAGPERPEEYAALYNASPFAQENQFDFLRTLIAEEKLGQEASFDFVGVALNSMAQLGYEVGADSPLMREMVLHLDRQIESTLEALRRAAGAGNFGLAFTGAHGVAPQASTSIDGSSLAAAIDGALSSAFDTSSGVRNRWVERYVYPFLYLNRAQLRRSGVDAAKARRLAGEAALQLAPGVAAYYTADGASSRSGEWLRRFQNSFHAVRSGDVMLAYEPNAVERYGAGRGLSYGSLYNYDVQTPLLLYGSQFRAVAEEDAVESVDIAPTLARALRVAPPSSSSGRVLSAAFAPDVKGTK